MADSTPKTAARSKLSGHENAVLRPELFQPYVQRLAALLEASARELKEETNLNAENMRRFDLTLLIILIILSA